MAITNLCLEGKREVEARSDDHFDVATPRESRHFVPWGLWISVITIKYQLSRR